MGNPRKASVLVADAEPVSRRGLIHFINDDPRLLVCGEAGSSREARALCEKLQPEVLVLDPAMDAGDGFILLKELPRWSAGTRAVMFTAVADALSVQRALKAGALGYVTRKDPASALIGAIAGALRAERHVGPHVEMLLLERLALGGIEMGAGDEAMLSERELQVYRLIGIGRSSREVAGELYLSVKTVETHRQRIKDKLHLPNGAELQRRAVLFAGTELGR